MMHSYTEYDPVVGGSHVKASFGICAEQGALILSGHAHTYRRFFPVPLREERHPHRSKMRIYANHTAQIISGLGGDSIHEDLNPVGITVNFGFVVCEFDLFPTHSADGDFYQAKCEFVNIFNEIEDDWLMRVPIPPAKTL